MSCFSSMFQVKQHEFREQFRTESIFKISVEEPYRLIDKVRCEVNVISYSEMKDHALQ